MSANDKIKPHLISALEFDLDPFMAGRNFVRQPKSLEYIRKIRDSVQSVDLNLQLRPKDKLDAYAALYPIMKVEIPAVDRLFDEMICGNKLLMSGITGGRSRQPVDFISQNKKLGRWFIAEFSNMSGVICDLRYFMGRWVVPFLDVFVTPDDVVRAYEQRDERMVGDRAQLIRVVAAALVCGRKEFARSVLESNLGSPGTRRRYQQIFDFVSQHA